MFQKRLLVCTIGVSILGFGTSAMAGVFVADDFNDNALDAAKWYTIKPNAASNVLEQNQRIEFTARGYLVTQSQITPSTVGHGGLRITGQYIFTNTDFNFFDYLSVVTRTSAVPGGTFSTATDGVGFEFWGNGSLHFRDRATDSYFGPTGTISIIANQPYNFTAIDDGTNVFLSLQQVGGTAFASISASDNASSLVNHVAFYNREFASSNGFLDNVVIDAVPEPVTLAFFPLARIVLLSANRRRSRTQ